MVLQANRKGSIELCRFRTVSPPLLYRWWVKLRPELALRTSLGSSDRYLLYPHGESLKDSQTACSGDMIVDELRDL